MNIDNQQAYWNSVAALKSFTHPLDAAMMERWVDKKARVVDFGCGYGRLVKQLTGMGYENVSGYDSSLDLIRRGQLDGVKSIFFIQDPSNLPVPDNSVDCILLFAVLTCIPSNAGQLALIDLLYRKLKKDGIIYISDYYLQEQPTEFDRYQYLNNDTGNFGVFTLPEGAVFRHHSKEWINMLLQSFTILESYPLQVTTMNGHSANGFQVIARK